MKIERSLINTHRSVWRSISSEMRAMDPNLFSRVQVHENGDIAGIFFLRDGEFVVEGAGLRSAFQNLDDAEDFAVQQLYEGSHDYD